MGTGEKSPANLSIAGGHSSDPVLVALTVAELSIRVVSEMFLLAKTIWQGVGGGSSF